MTSQTDRNLSPLIPLSLSLSIFFYFPPTPSLFLFLQSSIPVSYNLLSVSTPLLSHYLSLFLFTTLNSSYLLLSFSLFLLVLTFSRLSHSRSPHITYYPLSLSFSCSPTPFLSLTPSLSFSIHLSLSLFISI